MFSRTMTVRAYAAGSSNRIRAPALPDPRERLLRQVPRIVRVRRERVGQAEQWLGLGLCEVGEALTRCSVHAH